MEPEAERGGGSHSSPQGEAGPTSHQRHLGLSHGPQLAAGFPKGATTTVQASLLSRHQFRV